MRMLPPVRAPEFPEGLDWINTDGAAITLASLRGRLVLLDFWSSGCINCIHVIPHLERLAERFADAMTVIGVHAGKYPAERETPHLAQAVARLGVTHAVVNDRQFRTWRAYAVGAWPTLMLVDANGRVVATHAGEFTADSLALSIEELLGASRAATRDAMPHATEHVTRDAASPTSSPTSLRHPAGVALDVLTSQVAIADSGHHRVLVGALDAAGTTMTVTHVVGGTAPGFVDGALGDARFHDPHGLALRAGRVYVADRGNHAIREIDLDTGTVRTVAGTGIRAFTPADRAAGALASPWDVVAHRDLLYVAMAGMHQLWRVEPDSGIARVFAGSGAEGLGDGFRADAHLAQPMALAVGPDGLWFADAESNAVRHAAFGGDGLVTTAVGTGLFDFGDRDGEGDAVRLQHPQGVAWHPESGRALVSDSYNGALKWLEPEHRRVRTWARGLREPTAVACTADVVLVAETNGHRVSRVPIGGAGDGRADELVIR